MQVSRRALSLWTAHVRTLSNTCQPLRDAPENTQASPVVSTSPGRNCDRRSQEGGKRHLICQSVRLVEESASVDLGVLTWTAKHKDSADDDLLDDHTATSGKGLIEKLRHKASWIFRYTRNHAVHHFNALFLPTGYPDTVKPNYERYITAQAIQNVVASTNTVLSSTFMLYAVGLGAGAIPVSGAMNWIIKDGMGQLGTLIFGRVISHDFDINTRTWNFWAAATLNAACIVEILCMYVPEHFLVLGSLANMIKGLSWMAGGSTRAAFNVSFAKGENIADLTAKATSQYICTSLLGTAVGVVICSQVQSNPGTALSMSVVLSFFSLIASWSTIRAVPLSTLNHTRMQLLIDQYIRLNVDGFQVSVVDLDTPSKLCLVDPVVYIPTLSLDHRFRPHIHVGTQLSTLLKPDFKNVDAKLIRTLQVHQNCMHLLLRDGVGRDSRFHVILHENAGPPHAIEAMLHAALFRREIKKCQADVIGLDKEMQILQETCVEAHRHSACLQESMRRATWNLDRVCIENRICRATW